jgi:hypothetical protein
MQTQQSNYRYGGNKGGRERLTVAMDNCIVNCPIATVLDEFLVSVGATANNNVSDLTPRQSGGCRRNNQITGKIRVGVNV